LIGELEVLNEHLVDGQIGGLGAGPETPGEVLRQEPLVFDAALWRPEWTQVVVFPVEGHHRLTTGPMATVRRDTVLRGHRRSGLNPVITGLREPFGPLCHARSLSENSATPYHCPWVFRGAWAFRPRPRPRRALSPRTRLDSAGVTPD